MNFRRLVLLVLVFGVAFWIIRNNRRQKESGAPSGADTAAVTASFPCVSAAETANAKLHDAAMLVGRPPVDAGAWSAAQGDVSSAISSAESACGSPSNDAQRRAAEEVGAALSLMRSTLSVLDAQAHGQGTGGSTAVQNQEQIDAHLDRARGVKG